MGKNSVFKVSTNEFTWYLLFIEGKKKTNVFYVKQVCIERWGKKSTTKHETYFKIKIHNLCTYFHRVYGCMEDGKCLFHSL